MTPLASMAPPLFTVVGPPGDDEASCVLVLPAAAGNAVARLVVGLEGYTQALLYRLARQNQLYEYQTAMVALGALRPGDIALDIGAHVGYFTLLFRLAVGETGRVFAFEPLAETYRRLLHNVMINGFANVQPLPLAVAKQPGTAFFHINRENEGASSLLGGDGGEQVPVQVTSLDTLFRENLGIRPRLMKIDVEGAEMDVLLGAEKWFDRQGPDVVIVEIGRSGLAFAGANEWDIRQFFERRGYRAGVINGNREDQGIGNVFFRYYDADYRHVPLDSPYVFNEIYVRDGSGLFPNAE